MVKPFWILGIDVGVQNRVGAEEYGMYYPIFGFSILFNIVLDFGITNFNNRNIAQHTQMLGRYFSGIFNVKLFLGIVYMLITLVFGYFVGYEGKAFFLLFLLGINQFLSSMILYLRSNISGLHLFKTDGLLSILDRFLMIIICSFLLWSDYFGGEFKIEWFVYAQFWAYLLTAIAAFIIVYHKANFFKPKIDFILFKIILKESMPFALLVLLMAFYYRLDSVMVERMLPNGKVEAGIYAQAYRLVEGFNMFGYLFSVLLLPIFSRMIQKKESVKMLVHTSFNLIFIPSVAIAFICWRYAHQFMDLLYVEYIDSAAKVFPILMFSFIAIATTYVYGTLLTANGSLKQLNIISLIGLLVNFGLNLWWIPIDGAVGAAKATLITQYLVVISQIIVSKQIFKMPYSWTYILRLSIMLILAFGLGYYTSFYVNNYILHSIFIGGIFVVLGIALKLIHPKQVLLLIKKQ